MAKKITKRKGRKKLTILLPSNLILSKISALVNHPKNTAKKAKSQGNSIKILPNGKKIEKNAIISPARGKKNEIAAKEVPNIKNIIDLYLIKLYLFNIFL